MTEIVYLCSPDRWRQLLTSLNGLFNSGSKFDRVRILLIGDRTREWTFSGSSSITVESVDAVCPGFFLGNKVLLCGSTADRVVFVDTDTFIFGRLDALWMNRSEDLLARPGPNYLGARWKADVWEQTFAALAVPVVPMFNTGLLIFQNGSHRRVERSWTELQRRYLSGELIAPYPRNVSDQFALAGAVGLERLSYACLGAGEHSYGPLEEPMEDAILYHTGSLQYDRFYRRVRANEALTARLRPAFSSRMHRKARREDRARWARDKYRALVTVSKAWLRPA